MHEHVNIHILLSLLWDYVHTVVCEKVATGGLYRPTHLCVAHFELHVWRGRGGGWSMFQEVGGLHGVSEGGGVIYIYIYAFSRRFYPKRLTLHSSYSFTFYRLLLSLGIEPMILALLAPCSTI